MSGARPVQVFYDGSCGVCRASRRWLERRDPDATFEFVDACAAGAGTPPGVTAAQLDREVWVALPGGGLVSGYDAVVAALAILPHGRLAAGIGGLPPVRWAGRRIYKVVARLRRRR